MVRLGLIGAGRWGRVLIRTLRELEGEGIRLVRVASRNPETAALLPVACAISPSWRAMVAAPDVDGVIVATPPGVHAPMVEAALRAGKAVLVEKPLTLAPAEAETLLDLAEAQDALVQVDHVHLFNQPYRELKARLARLGTVRTLTGEAGGPGPFRPDVSVLWDWGPHDVAMFLDLMGERPERVSAERPVRRSTPDGVEETVVLRLGFANGVEATARLSNHRPDKVRRLEVRCTGGMAVYDDRAEARLTVSEAGGPAVPLPWDGVPPLTRAVREFAAALAAGRRDRSGLRLGVEVVRILAACQAALART